MKSNFKRLMGILLAMLMVVSMIPATAIADGALAPSDSANYLKLANGTELLYNTTDGDYVNFLLAEDLAGRDGAEGFVIVDGEYHIAKAFQEDSGLSVADATLAKLPAEMVEYVQTREYGVNMVQGASELGKVNTKASIPNYGTIKAHRNYLQSMVDDNSITTVGGYAGSNGLGCKFIAVNNFNTFYQLASPSQKVVSDGPYFVGSIFAEFYVNKDFFKTTKIDTEIIGENVIAYMLENVSAADLVGLYTKEELMAIGYAEENIPDAPVVNPDEPDPDEPVIPDEPIVDNILTTSPNYVALSNGTELLYNGKDGNYFNFVLAEDLAGRDGAEGFVIVDGEYHIAKAYQEDSGKSVADAAMAKLPAEMADYVQTREYGVNMVLGAGELGKVNTKASIPNYTTIKAHRDYLQPMVDDNSITTVGGYAGNNGLGCKFIAVNNYNAWYQLASPSQTIVSDGRYFVGSIFAEFYVHKDFLTAVKLDTTVLSEEIKTFMVDNYAKSQLSGLYTEDELNALGIKDIPTNVKPEHSVNYLKLADGTELLYNGEDGDYINFVLAEDLAGRDGAEGFVIVDGEYHIAKAFQEDSGSSVADATLAKLPAEMAEYVQTRNYNVNLVLGAAEHGTVSTKASIPNYATISAHGDYLKSMIDDNSITTVGGFAGNNGLGCKFAAVNNYNTWYQQAYPGNTVVSDGRFFVGSVFAEFYVHKDFFRAVKVDVETLNAKFKSYIAANYITKDLKHLYTAEEMNAMGVQPFIEHEKGSDGSADTYEFVVGGKKYVVLPNAIEENGEKYFAVISTTKEETAFGHMIFDDANQDPAKDGIKYIDIYHYDLWGTNAKNDLYDDNYVEKFFPSATFGNYTEERDWNIRVFSNNDGKWMWGSEGPYELRYSGVMTLPSPEQMSSAKKSNPGLLNGDSPVRYLAQYPAWGVTAGLFWVNSNGDTCGIDNVLIYSASDGMTTRSTGAYPKTSYYMVYVHEDFFKETAIDLSTAGGKFKQFIRDNYTSEDLIGWNSADINKIFGGYNGEGIGLEMYGDSSVANVIVHNNGTEADGNGAVIIVAAYAGNVMVDLKTVTLEKGVSANHYTNPFEFSFDIAEGTVVTSTKAMLWGSLTNCKPLTSSVEH